MAKLFECYVANPTRMEAIEIVERLIANGADVYDVVEGMVIDHKGYSCTYDEYSCWGYNSEFGTYTGYNDSEWARRSKQLTMQEFRSAFPCDKYDGVTKDWDGEGLPPVGTVCEFASEGHHMGYWWCIFHGLLSCGGYIIEFHHETSPSYVTCDAFDPHTTSLRPIKSDRDKFIESAVKAFNSGCMADYSGQPFIDGIAALYDAGFTSPESK